MRKLLLGVSLLCLALWGQTTTSRLSGTVVDPSSSIVPAARVTCVNKDTGLRQETVTDARGAFLFPALPPGAYTISAEASGFSRKVINDYRLTVSEVAGLVIQLALGDVTTTVEVESRNLARVDTV